MSSYSHCFASASKPKVLNQRARINGERTAIGRLVARFAAAVDLPDVVGRGLDEDDGGRWGHKDSNACWCDDWKKSEPVKRMVFE